MNRKAKPSSPAQLLALRVELAQIAEAEEARALTAEELVALRAMSETELRDEIAAAKFLAANSHLSNSGV